MAKLAILLALLSLLALSHVTAFRTMVDDEDGQQHCQEQITRQSNMQSCQRYLTLGHQSQLESFYGCCRELGGIHQQCRCHAINYAFRQQRRPGEMEGLQKRAAENIFSKCKLSPQRCQVESIWA